MERVGHRGLGFSVPWATFAPIELSTLPNIHVLQGLMVAVVICKGKKTALLVQQGTTVLVVSHLRLALVILDTTAPVVC